MITFNVEPNAVPNIASFMERVRFQIIAAIRGGMREAMKDLAKYIVATKLSGSPIGRMATPNKLTKPGDLSASILAGVRVGGNEEEIYGTLSGRPKNMPNLGYWQEFGTNHPAVSGKLNVFVGKDGNPVFTHHLAAFSIAPRPFLNPSLDEQKGQIMETIRASLAAAELG
jgi:hypothetical protein